MKAAALATLLILLAIGNLPVSAKVNIFYQATLLDEGQAASGKFDVKFTLYEKSSGGSPIGVAYTNAQVVVSNGLLRAGLICRNDDVRLKRGWVEAAIRLAGADGPFLPMRARVEDCRNHAAGTGKSCDTGCDFVALRLHTYRLPCEFDPPKPWRGRGFLHLPKELARAKSPEARP
jgi:hypothetical protein